MKRAAILAYVIKHQNIPVDIKYYIVHDDVVIRIVENFHDMS